MKARTDRNGIIVFVLILSRPLEHLTEGENSRRRLVLARINASCEGIDHLFAIAMMDEGCKGKRLFPKQVNHVLEVVGSLLAKEHVLSEWVSQVATLASEICQHMRHSKFRFSQSRRDAKGKNGIDETVSITDADKAFSAKAADLVGVVRNYVHFLDQLYVGDVACESGVNPGKSTAEELFGRLP